MKLTIWATLAFFVYLAATHNAPVAADTYIPSPATAPFNYGAATWDCNIPCATFPSGRKHHHNKHKRKHHHH
jgi:hypothetical protein